MESVSVMQVAGDIGLIAFLLYVWRAERKERVEAQDRLFIILTKQRTSDKASEDDIEEQ